MTWQLLVASASGLLLGYVTGWFRGYRKGRRNGFIEGAQASIHESHESRKERT